MPKPYSGEDKEKFLQRCMSDNEAISDFPDEKQRYAFCQSQFNNKAMIEHDLIGDIGFEITAKKISSFLESAKGDDITFYIASLGGDLNEGITIHSLIKKYKGNTKGVIIGNTASAGTIAILGCNIVEANENAPFLIHNSIDPEGGNAQQLKKKAEQLEKHDKIMLNIYKQKTGLADEQIMSLMQKEDWLSPAEAKNYGFIDNIIMTNYRAVAYYSKNKLSDELITKLNNKMKLFGKDKKPAHLVALKDGSNILASSEMLAEGVELAPLGEATIEDGTFELKDGRKIVVSGGIITEVKSQDEEEKKDEEMEAFKAEIIDNVSAVVATEVAKVEASIDAKIEALKKIGSTHTPAKQVKTGTPPKAEMQSVHDRISEKTAAIRQQIVESRKA